MDFDNLDNLENLKSNKGNPFKLVAKYNIFKNRYKDPFDREAAWLEYIKEEYNKGRLTKEELKLAKNTASLESNQSW